MAMKEVRMMNTGLEGVYVADTRLSDVDGERGALVIAGRHLEQFSLNSFEQAAQELLGRSLDLGRGRIEAYRYLRPWLGELVSAPQAIDALRRGLSLLRREASTDTLISAVPIILAGRRQGEALLPPDPSFGQVEDFLRMFRGRVVSPGEIAALSAYLTTVSEHGMNASTFTARVIASTGASSLEAVLGALGALAGPLHGGAPGPVLDLLDELDDVSDLKGVLQSKIRNGERLMGFGHRVYRTRDPRADVLRSALSLLPESPRLVLAQQVEQEALKVLREEKPDRRLETNVEYYTALLLDSLGFSREEFTPVFAAGRILGWLAHVEEQKSTGRLIRPLSRYVGLAPSNWL